MLKVRGTGVGYYSFRFNHLFGNTNDVFVCRLETLRQDLLQFLDNIDAITDKIKFFILTSEKKNTAEHLHYAHYYTPELAELVSVRDRQLIQNFGYAFEHHPAQKKT